MDTNLKKIKEEMKTGQGEMRAIVSAILQETKAWPEKWVEISEETEVSAEGQRIPNREATVETIRAMEVRSGGQQLAVGYHNPRKIRIKGNVIQRTSKGQIFWKQ
jgi:hypothetical protein